MKSLIKVTVSEAMIKGSKNKIKAPLMYKGFIVNNYKTKKGYKLGAFSYRDNKFINPLYNSFEAIKLIIDNLK